MVSPGFDRSLAITIGINDYRSGISPLQSARADAEAIAELLETQYQYQVIRLTDTTEVKPTLENIKQLLEQELPTRLNSAKKARVLVYYAGHGIAESNNAARGTTGSSSDAQEGPRGYLIPQDAKRGDVATYLSMYDLHQSLCKLKCLHLLVVLDCCFGGMFQWASSRKLIPVQETIYKQHYERFTTYPAWEVITSTAHDQEALDLSIDRRTGCKDSLHSPFAMALLEGLQQQKADLIRDDIITAHELYVYLDNRIDELCGEQQKPGIYPLKPEYERGEFIFTHPDFNEGALEDAPHINERNNPYRGLQPFEERNAEVFFGRDDLIDQLSQKLMPVQPSSENQAEQTTGIKVEDQTEKTKESKAAQKLLIVSGVSGSGKSSLVMAGLIPKLRQQSKQKWYILNPMRPGKSPFTRLAQSILPIEEENLVAKFEELKFLDEYFRKITARDLATEDIESKETTGQNHNSQKLTHHNLNTLADDWDKAKPEAKLILILNHFNQLKDVGLPEERERLSEFHKLAQDKFRIVKQDLKQNPQYLADRINAWSEKNPDVSLLLVIDQLEELITMSPVSQNHQHQPHRQTPLTNNQQPDWFKFLETLKLALDRQPGHLHLVLTLRSDFDIRFQNTPLQSYWKDACFQVDAMTSEELRQAIEKPAHKRAIYFEPPKLVSDIIDDVRKMPGALPLLSFTLSELYRRLQERWRTEQATDRTLCEKDYIALGGVTQALTKRAAQEYDALVTTFGEEKGKQLQVTMRRILLRMVSLEGGGTRRRVPESELQYPGDEENKDTKIILNRLVKSRLVIAGQEAGEIYYEPAHDCLVVNWLQQWVRAEEKEEIALQRLLTPAAREWQQIVVQWRNDHRVHYWIDAISSKTWQIISSLWNRWELHEISKYQQKSQTEEPSQANPKQFLWHANPRLNLLKRIFHCNSWFNQQEFEFVQESISRKRKVFLKNGGILVGTLLTVWSITTLVSDFHQSLRKVAEYNLKAENELLSEQNLDSLVYAIRANKAFEDLILLRFADQLMKNNAIDKLCNSIGLNPCQDIEQLKNNSQRILTRAIYYKIDEFNQLEDNTYETFAAQFSLDGSHLITAGYDGKIRLWNLTEQRSSEHSPGPIKNANQNSTDSKAYAVSSIALSQDGKRVATADFQGFVRIWAYKGKKLEHQTVFFASDDKAEKKGIRHLAISPSNPELLATAGLDGTVRLWSISTGKPLLVIPKAHQGRRVEDVNFSPDGQLLATAGGDGIVRIYQVDKLLTETASFATRSPLAECQGHLKTETETEKGKGVNRVFSVQFNPINPKQLITSGLDRTARLWTLETKQDTDQMIICRSEAVFKGHEKDVNSASFSSTGELIATASDDGSVRLWNLKGDQLDEFRGHQGIVYSVSFSPDGNQVVSAGEDGTVRFWKWAKHFKPIETGFSVSRAVQFSSATEKRLAIAGDQGRFSVWRTDASWNPTETICEDTYKKTDHIGQILSLSFNYDGNLLAVGGEDGKVSLWNVNQDCIKQAEQVVYPENSDNYSNNDINNLDFNSQNGNILAAALGNGTVQLWYLGKLEDGNLQQKLRKPLSFIASYGAVWSVKFSPDGQRLVTTSNDGAVRVWDMNKLQEKLQFSLLQGTKPDLTDLGASALLGECPGHQDYVEAISFHPDGNILATSDSGGTVLLCNLNSSIQYKQYKRLGKVIRGYRGDVYGLAFSPDGQTLAVGDKDGTARLWDLEGNLVGEFPEHHGQIYGVAFSPDGRTLAVTDSSQIVHLWQIREFNELLQESCSWVRDYLRTSPNAKEFRTICDDIYTQNQHPK